MTTDAKDPDSPFSATSEELGDLDPAELLARGLNTVQPTAGSPRWIPPTPEELALLLPQYRIERMLGHGGMGAVYQGEQPQLERKVAIKLLPADLAQDPQFVTRFQREARMLAKLQHPGIVAVFDFGQTTEGHPYFVMEYVEGTDLQRLLRGPGLNPLQAIELIAQICDALQAAHRQGVIHRDIKPANILLSVDGRAKVADFGLARPPQGDGDDLTQTDFIMGTPGYMAPEQQTGHADHRADIFALGVMLYEMLTGEKPHGVFDPPSQKVRVDVRIDKVVLKAMHSQPERRYQQVSEMRTDVERIRTTPLPAQRRPVPPPSPSPWPLAIGLALLVAVLMLVAWLLDPHTKPGPSTAVAHAKARPGGASPLPSPVTPRNPVPAAFRKARAQAQNAANNRPAPTAAQPSKATPLPVPARPTAVQPPIVSQATSGALEAALVETDWLFTTANASGTSATFELRFLKNHIVRTNRGTGAVWHWWITGERAVHLQLAADPDTYDPQRGANLMFDPSFKKFDGLAPGGLRAHSGKRLGEPPPSIAAKPSPGATPARAPLPALPSSTPATAAAPSVDLFDAQHGGAWRHDGPGGLRAEGALLTTFSHKKGFGVSWYGGQTFANFTLRLEYLTPTPNSNSGVFVRCPAQNANPNQTQNGYEVQILGAGPLDQSTGAIYGFQAPHSVPQKANAWNLLEITVIQQNYVVTLNGVVTNRFTGSRALAGYIGLQCHPGGPVQFRNVRLTNLPAPSAPIAPAVAPKPPAVQPAATPLRMASLPVAPVLAKPVAAATPEDDSIHVSAVGPSGTNFGGGNAILKINVSLATKGTKPRQLQVDCFWLVWDGRHHQTVPVGGRAVTLSASSPQSFELKDDKTFERNHHSTNGINSTAGQYRGWVVSVHEGGKKVAGAANKPEFEHFAE